MNILVTGGFGAIGRAVVEECLSRGHAATVFEVRNGRTERLARRYGRRGVAVRFGDLRNEGDLRLAVAGADAVIHLAAILPPVSDARPELCAAVNVGGTANLIGALRAANPGAALVSVSSASVMGSTQRRDPPVRPGDPLVPTDPYSRSKIEAESLVAASGLKRCVLRLAAVLPTRPDLGVLVGMARLLFDMPLDARCEIVVDLDVACALVSAAENLAGPGELAGATGFVAGGAAGGCQIRTRELVRLVFVPIGLRAPDESLFAPDLDSYYLDWYDTDSTQAILRYQRHGAEEWRSIVARATRPLRPLIVLLRPAIMRWLERQSPRYGARSRK